jgi:hypothetical protein
VWGAAPYRAANLAFGKLGNLIAFINMAFTLLQLEALEKAIAEGVTRVKYENKEVEYRSLEEMMQLLSIMQAQLGLKPKSQRILAKFSKGLDGC